MTQPYVGEVRMFAGIFPPAGWMLCDGQLLPIDQHEALFQLIGTTYGGDGRTTFALPDLRGRLPLHQGDGVTLGERGGQEAVAVTADQLPAHTHQLLATAAEATAAGAPGNLLATTTTDTPYSAGAATTPMAATAVGPTGGSQPHDNLQPYLCVNYIISLLGIFPSPR